MENIWAYDFDKTVYDGDSSVDFFFFCLVRKKKLLKYIPIIIFYMLLYLIRFISVKDLKEKFFSFLKSIPNIDELVDDFWMKNRKKIYPFFEQELQISSRPVIYIISASPEFLINGYTKNLDKIKLIATKMDKKTGKIIGENCKGKEKVKRLEKESKKIIIEKFYSDSSTDMPLAEKSKNAYIVCKGKCEKWNDEILKKKKQKCVQIGIFVFFVGFYFILGVYLSYLYDFSKTYDLIFGADTSRVLGDMTDVFGNHYRIKVHPLFVMIVAPFIYILNGITLDSVLSVIILSSLIGSLSVVVMYKIASIYIEEERTKILLMLIFGFSFTNLIFSSSTETFIFSGFFLILLWYFIITLLNKKEKINKIEYFYLILLGVISLGITITNIVVFLIIILTLLINKKIKFKKAFLIVILVFLLSIFLSLIQNFVWHNTPTLLQYKENYQEEEKYTNYDISIPKIKNVIINGFVNSIIASDVRLSDTDNIYFLNNNSWTVVPVIIFYLLIIYFLIKNGSKNKILNIGVLLTVLFNCCLHTFYGNGEVFLYSCHFIYLVFLLLILNYKTLNHKNRINIILLILLVIQLIENAKIFKQVINLSSSILTPTYYRVLFHNPCLLIGIIFILFMIYLFSYLFYKNLKKFTINNDNKVFYLIMCILCIVSINLIFIGIHTTPKYNKILNISIKK